MTFVIAWIGLAALVLLFNRGAHMRRRHKP